MLFNAPEFLFSFLPIAVIGFFIAARFIGHRVAVIWLILASLVFYGWWRIDLVLLLAASVVFNYSAGLLIARHRTRLLLAAGIAGNLAILGWFKYSGFFATVLNDLTSLGVPVPHVILPLGISFYTFQQIAYLADTYADDVHEPSFARYALFVTFFPQLVAGPIVHHREMLPQFDKPEIYRPDPTNLILGLTAFGIGLFKKVCIADPLAGQTPVAFGPAAEGLAPNFIDSWYGSIAFALQIYFDFSGYSDMAIGLGLMFGIKLPVNFSSPYRAGSIIDFWARWHMTLTRFLTAYLYNPIAMSLTRRRAAAGKPNFNRNKPKLEPFIVLVAAPTLITMTLAGIWHGAGWTFLIFGVWHGLLLTVNQGWRALRRVFGWTGSYGWPGKVLAVVVTFAVVTVGHVWFKSTSVDQALTIMRGMAGFGGDFVEMATRLGNPAEMNWFEYLQYRFVSFQGVFMISAFLIIFFLPNTAQYIERISAKVKERVTDAPTILRWPLIRHVYRSVMPAQPNFVQGTAVGILLALALLRATSEAPTEFLYFTF